MEFVSLNKYSLVTPLTGFKFSFLPDLRERCTADMGNEEFWSQVKEAGRPLSLISEKEASKYGGTSSISESKSKEVCSFLSLFFGMQKLTRLEPLVYCLTCPVLSRLV